MKGLIGGLVVYANLVSLAFAVACSNGGATTLSVAYKYDGSFTVSIAHSPATNYCSVQVLEWGGAGVSGTYRCGACNNFSPAAFTPAGDTLAPLSYGVEYGFGLSSYSASNCSGTAICTAPSVYVTPPLCTGANYGYTALSVIKAPFAKIKASVTNKPSTGSCYYHLTKWDGSLVSVFSGTDDCSPVLFHPTAFDYGQTYTVGMIAITASSDPTAVQPLCGINPTSIMPIACSSTLSPAVTGLDTVTITISGASPGQKCEVYVLTWSDTSVASRGLTKTSPDCSSVTFSTSEIGAPLALGTPVYGFEHAEFPIGTLNTGFVDPSCSSIASPTTFDAPSCDVANVQMGRPDPGTIRVTILSARSYGICRVSLVLFGTTTYSVYRVGSCAGNFDFYPPTGALTYTTGTAMAFVFEYFANSDLTSSPTCTSDSASFNVPAFSCTGITFALDSHTPFYTASISGFSPSTGACFLTNSVNSARIQFPSCIAAMRIGFTDIQAVIPALTAGQSVDFNYVYVDVSGTDKCTGTPVTGIMTVELSVALGAVTAGSITVGVGTLPSFLTSVSPKTCRAVLDQCGSTHPNTPTKTIANCAGTVTYNDPTDTPTGSICKLHVELDIGNGYSAGSSDYVFAVAAGVPVWGSTQTPSVKWYGSSCVDVSWDVPASNGGSAVTCYDLQRKDGVGSYATIATCITAQTFRTCSFTVGTPYYFQVIAVSGVGRSANGTCVSPVFYPEWHQSAPASVISAPKWNENSYVAGGFPTIKVMENHPTNPVGPTDANTTDRLFVGRLLNRCKLDSATSTISQALVPSDTNYSSLALPIPANSPPAFTQVFVPVGITPGTYELVPYSQPPKGPYSLVVHSLEEGGLRGQYFANTALTGAFTFERKDPLMDFSWGSGAILNGTTGPQVSDLVSIRWTGFIEAAYAESYLFTVTSLDHVRVWVDNVIIINKWTDDNMCGGSCSGRATLQQTVPGDGSRKFSYIRIDYSYSRASVGGRAAAFKLSWSSFSQPMEVIPYYRLFKAPIIQSTVLTITVGANVQSATKSVATPPSTSVVAGTTYAVLVTAKDQYGNVLASNDTYFYAQYVKSGQTTITRASVPVNATNTDGLYTIPLVLTVPGVWTVNVFDYGNAAVVGSGRKVTVVAGDPYSLSGTIPSGSVVGVPIYIPLVVSDSSGNVLSGASMTTMPAIFLSAEWTSDIVTQGRLPYDDADTRASRFGTVFTNATISWNTTTSTFQAVITLPRAGVYTVEAGIDDQAAPVTLSSLTVTAVGTSLATFAIVTTAPFPPTDLTVGTAAVFTVQLRDKYMNAIASAFVGTAPTVLVRLETITSYTQATCSASSTLGQFTCTITPVIAGASLALSILVDGTQASYMSNLDGSIRTVRGPWLVPVAGGQAVASHCLLQNVRTTYTVGIPVTATLILRDVNNNVLGHLDVPPAVTVSFTDVSSTTTYVDSTTFVYNADGTFSLPIVSYVSSGAGYFTLAIKVGGSAVTLPYGIDGTAITVAVGPVSAAHTVCDAWADAVAGVTQSSVCHPADVGDYGLILPHLYVYSNFSYRADPTVAPVVVAATYNSGDHFYDLATGVQLTKAGTYSYYTLLAQPGGLIGQYYSDMAFSELIGAASDGTSLSDQRQVDEDPLYYTRIDSYISVDNSGPIVVNGLTAASVRWSGLVMPAVTDTYTFNITCNGGVRVVIGGGTAQIDSMAATSVNTTFNVSLTAYTPVSIVIEYAPSGTAAIALRWAYLTMSTYAQIVVPSQSLTAPLITSQTGNHLVVVSPGAVSTQSTAYFSDSIIAGQADFIIVQAIDASGNHYTANPSSCVATSVGFATVPLCLFKAVMSADDGTTFVTPPVLLSDGTIKIGVTFAADGPKQVSVKLQTSSGTFTDIHGSPYSIVVNPGPPTIS